jgi:hypothetical protein
MTSDRAVSPPGAARPKRVRQIGDNEGAQQKKEQNSVARSRHQSHPELHRPASSARMREPGSQKNIYSF